MDLLPTLLESPNIHGNGRNFIHLGNCLRFQINPNHVQISAACGTGFRQHVFHCFRTVPFHFFTTGRALQPWKRPLVGAETANQRISGTVVLRAETCATWRFAALWTPVRMPLDGSGRVEPQEHPGEEALGAAPVFSGKITVDGSFEVELRHSPS